MTNVNKPFNRNSFIKKLRPILRDLAGKRMYQIYKVASDEGFSVDVILDGRVHPVGLYYWSDIESGKTGLDEIKKTVEQALQGVFQQPGLKIKYYG